MYKQFCPRIYIHISAIFLFAAQSINTQVIHHDNYIMLSALIVSLEKKKTRNLTPMHSINTSSSILSNLAKIQKLKGRLNYQSWKSTMEGVLELEGLWDIVSGKQLRPEIRKTTSTRSNISSTITVSNSEALDTWVTHAYRAWITIDLLIVTNFVTL